MVIEPVPSSVSVSVSREIAGRPPALVYGRVVRFPLFRQQGDVFEPEGRETGVSR